MRAAEATPETNEISTAGRAGGKKERTKARGGERMDGRAVRVWRWEVSAAARPAGEVILAGGAVSADAEPAAVVAAAAGPQKTEVKVKQISTQFNIFHCD
ncbi:Protein of unknown function [Gryllus bimaculatus]|nr:Protein of unknown function [Gryllus bimaculatus]